MARIAVKDLQEGAILAADVVDHSGRVLLPSGAAIQNKHLQVFKAWGVRTVEVVDDGQVSGPEPSDDQLQSGLEYANSLLRLNEESHELIQMLRLLIQRRYAGKLAEQEEA